MKKYNLLILAVFFVLAMPVAGKSAQEVYKEWNRSYKVASDARLEVNNKFGDIEVLTWAKPEVKVEVTISAEGSNRERIQSLVATMLLPIWWRSEPFSPMKGKCRTLKCPSIMLSTCRSRLYFGSRIHLGTWPFQTSLAA